MDRTALIILIVVVAAVLAAAAVYVSRRKRSEHLREKFGPEYDRTIKQHGDARHAERVLADREDRVKKFALRTLPAPDRERYANDWAAVQRRFVDDPAGAVTQADKLVTQVMDARGYPTGDFEQRAADISTDYPVVVENYRAAHDIALRDSRGQASTEDLRKAMVHYRSLFEELLGDAYPQRKEARA